MTIQKETAISRYRMVHTIGKTIAGGEKGGFCSVWYSFILSWVRKADNPPTARVSAEQPSRHFQEGTVFIESSFR